MEKNSQSWGRSDAKQYAWVIVALCITIILLFVTGQPQPPNAFGNTFINQSPNTTMQLLSEAFENNGTIPSDYTCDGKDMNPPFSMTGIPEETQSLAFIVDDPDAPGGTWVHWLVWNILPQEAMIAQNMVPHGAVEGKSSFGKAQYGGPCPPSGTHHYRFKLYALDTLLNLPSGATVQQLEKAMTGHIIEQTMLIGLYSKK